MADGENQFVYGSAGQADWDTTLNADLSIIEKGYRSLGQAGMTVRTGHVLWMNSGGFFFHFDPNSTSIYPTHFAHIGAASGDSMTPIAWGAVKSLGICSPAVPGQPLFVSMSTPGVVVGSYTAADRQIGWGLPNYGVLFKPTLRKPALSHLTDVNTNGVLDGKVLTWQDASSKWVPVTPSGGGITAIAQASDVNTNGVSNGKVLTWQDASSKWVPATPGTGGVTVGAVASIVQTGFSSADVASLGFTFAATPTVGNLIMFFTCTNHFLNLPTPGLSTELRQEQKDSVGTNDGTIGVHIILADGTTTFGFGTTDGSRTSIYGLELNSVGRIEARGSNRQVSPNVASGGTVSGPAAAATFGNALAWAIVADDTDISSSTISTGWDIAKAFPGGSFGGHMVVAVKSGSIGANSFSIPQWTLVQSAHTNITKALATVLAHPRIT